MQYLHKNNIVLRNLNTSNIVLNRSFYPHLADLSLAIQTDMSIPYLLSKKALRNMNKYFVAPELHRSDSVVNENVDLKTLDKDVVNNFIKIQSSKELDVYSYGAVLYALFTGNHYVKNDPWNFPIDFDDVWKKLILNCMRLTPEYRPNFDEICEIIEKKAATDERINPKTFNIYKYKFYD